MEENWFIALHSVTTGNDLNAMSEQSVREFVEKSIVYTVEDMPGRNGNDNGRDCRHNHYNRFSRRYGERSADAGKQRGLRKQYDFCDGTSGGNENPENPVFVAG